MDQFCKYGNLDLFFSMYKTLANYKPFKKEYNKNTVIKIRYSTIPKIHLRYIC